MRELVLNLIVLFHRVVRIDMVKIFSFTAMSTLVKMLTGLISVKVVATIIGPTGVALIGQLNNFSSIIMTVGSGGINSGITKYIAEYREDKDKITFLLSAALRITIICSLTAGVLMILFHHYLSEYIMLSPEYGYIFVIFGFTVLLYALNMMLTSIINGFKEFKKYVRINIANSIVGLVFTLSMVLLWGLKGALISAVTYQSIMLFVTLWMVRKLPWLKGYYFKKKLSLSISKKYFSYTMMTMTACTLGPLSQMLLRGYVISEISAIEAGWWEAMNRISGMYLMIITTSFTVYYLPRLSEISDSEELKKEILRSYKIIIPMLVIAFLFIYVLRRLIIQILFTPIFCPMENLFIWQLLGDFFKISSWLLAFLMVAKSMTRIYITTEIVFSLLFIGLGFLFMQWNGIVGITQGYLINYILYMLTMVFIFRKLLFA